MIKLVSNSRDENRAGMLNVAARLLFCSSASFATFAIAVMVEMGASSTEATCQPIDSVSTLTAFTLQFTHVIFLLLTFKSQKKTYHTLCGCAHRAVLFCFGYTLAKESIASAITKTKSDGIPAVHSPTAASGDEPEEIEFIDLDDLERE
jgi:multisubunit Na+/H+ antiporter MnhC subunit